MTYDLIINPIWMAEHIVRTGQFVSLCGFDVDFTTWVWMELSLKGDKVEIILNHPTRDSRICKKCMQIMKNENGL
jgi:hypothetical protein